MIDNVILNRDEIYSILYIYIVTIYIHRTYKGK